MRPGGGPVSRRADGCAGGGGGVAAAGVRLVNQCVAADADFRAKGLTLPGEKNARPVCREKTAWPLLT